MIFESVELLPLLRTDVRGGQKNIFMNDLPHFFALRGRTDGLLAFRFHFAHQLRLLFAEHGLFFGVFLLQQGRFFLLFVLQFEKAFLLAQILERDRHGGFQRTLRLGRTRRSVGGGNRVHRAVARGRVRRKSTVETRIGRRGRVRQHAIATDRRRARRQIALGRVHRRGAERFFGFLHRQRFVQLIDEIVQTVGHVRFQNDFTEDRR